MNANITNAILTNNLQTLMQIYLPDEQNENGSTFLMVACWHIDKISTEYGSPYEIIKFIIKQESADYVNAKNNRKNTALYFACWNTSSSAKQIIQYLLEVGAILTKNICDKNRLDESDPNNFEYGDTPLHIACQYKGNLPIVKLLVNSIIMDENENAKNNDDKKRITINTKNNNGETPLYCTKRYANDKNMQSYIISVGGNYMDANIQLRL